MTGVSDLGFQWVAWLTATKWVCPKFALFCVAPNVRKESLKCTFEKENNSLSFYERLHLKIFYLWTLASYLDGYAKATKTHLIKLIVLVILRSVSEGLTYFISIGRKSQFWKHCDRRQEELVHMCNLLFSSKLAAFLQNSGLQWINSVFFFHFCIASCSSS